MNDMRQKSHMLQKIYTLRKMRVLRLQEGKTKRRAL